MTYILADKVLIFIFYKNVPLHSIVMKQNISLFTLASQNYKFSQKVEIVFNHIHVY